MTLTAAQSARLDSRIDALLAAAPPAGPGLALGLLRAGEPPLLRGAGLASIEHRVPIDPARTRFRIASVSKQFTVAAVLRLEAQGLLARTDDVRLHCPELAALPRSVTLEHLMRNTSGLPDFIELLRLGGCGLEQRVERASLLDAIARAAGHLNFAPGSRFLYSNSNFLLLGLIVERLSGVALGAYLREHFFAPLGLRDTEMVVDCDAISADLAAPYLPRGDGDGHQRALHGFEHGGEGGLVSTVPDLLRWAAVLLDPPPGYAAVVGALKELAPLTGGHASPYACGLEHGRWLGRDCIGHGGLWPGYKTEFVLLPAERLAAVVIANDGGANPYKLARELLAIALEAPPMPAAAAVASDFGALAGRWFDAATGILLELFEQHGAAMARQWGVAFELYRDGDGWRAWRGVYEFRLGAADGDTLRLELGAGRVAALARLPALAAGGTDIAGRWRCEPLGATWEIAADGSVAVAGPLATPAQRWQLRSLGGDWLELQSPGYWMTTSQLVRMARAGDGAVVSLVCDGARVKGLELHRIGR